MSVELLALKLAQFAGQADDGRARPAMLELARQLSQQPMDRIAAFLWLNDTDKQCLHLDYHSPDATPLLGLSLEVPTSQTNDAAFVQSAILKEPRIAEWLRSHNLEGAVPTLVPVANNLGFINFFAPATVKPSPLLEGLCTAIAARIGRHRDKRKLLINEALAKTSWNQDTTVDAWLQSAAEIARTHTNAKRVLVFRLNRDMELEVVADARDGAKQIYHTATSTSLVQQIYNQASKTRILNHYDNVERAASFKTTSYDAKLVAALEAGLGEKLRSWICTAITYQNDPIAVMFVANKDEKTCIPSVFSRTDFSLVNIVCDWVSRTMPQLQTHTAIRQISDATFRPRAPDSQPDAESEGPQVKLDAVVEALKDHIPGLAGAAIGLRMRAGEPSLVAESFQMAGGVERSILERRLKAAMPKESKTPQPVSAGYFVMEQFLPNIGEDRVATLHILLKRQRLAAHELNILEYTSSNLAQFIRDQHAISKRNRELIEFRHAVRSGLQGLGVLDSACETYDLLVKQGQIPTKLINSVFGKSLKLALSFVARTRNIVESMRFRIGSINRSQLRLNVYNLVKIVRFTATSLVSEASRRGIVIIVNEPHYPINPVGDDELIKLLVYNLLDNAVKYSYREQNVVVEMSLQNNRWELAVINTGMLIASDEYDRIFLEGERGTAMQAHSAQRGDGIGLALVKKVVQCHSGSYHVTSVAQDDLNPKGCAQTTFRVSIPLKL